MRIGADVEEEQLADVAVGDEGLFAVQDPLVAVPFRPQLDARLGFVRRQTVVGTTTRRGDALSEHKGIIGEKRLKESFLLLFGADRGDQMAPLPTLAESLRHGAVALGEFRHYQS